MTRVVDTNVILVANGQHADVSPGCIVSCAQQLAEIQARGRIAIDDRFRILKEYQNKTTPKTGNRVGDVFVKWLLRNCNNTTKCDQVTLNEFEQDSFQEFPQDGRLSRFDPPDRKFVAVAMTHPEKPNILQAADSKWVDWAPALGEHGIKVDFLCMADVDRFHTNKFNK